MDLSNIFPKIAMIDEYNDFAGKITFLKPVTVGGGMFLTGTINKIIDIATLADKTVKRDSQQHLTGAFKLNV